MPPDLPHPTADEGPQAEQAALLGALEQLLEPLARLCVAKGVGVQAVQERLRRALVRAAREACEREHPGQRSGRFTSRMSTMTGLTRREVSRLDAAEQPRRNTSRTLVSDVFAHWLADPACRSTTGQLLALPRQGPHPSFESLTASVTRDVHPRSLLDEMVRLGWARLDAERDEVALCQDAFVPRERLTQMFAYLGDNVGDHFTAAVSNVLGEGEAQFEQAIYADELSTASLEQARRLITAQWQSVLTGLLPTLQALMDDDRAAGRLQDQSLRLGLYALTQPMPAGTPPASGDDSNGD